MKVARHLLTDGEHICAITVGPSDEEALTQTTQMRDRILGLDQWLELSEIIVNLVQQVCDLPYFQGACNLPMLVGLEMFSRPVHRRFLPQE